MRCGNPSSQQWQICALDNKWVGICDDCDIELNRMVLEFVGVSSKDVYCLIEDYKTNKSGVLLEVFE